jgi:streptogramin lyase
LSVEVTCPVPGCLDLKPVNDAVQNRLQVTIRQSGESLSAGDHLIPFALRYDDGSTIEFEVALLAEQEPSAAFSEMVQAATGAPQLVQTVVAPGAFAYHAISAFDAIWIIDSSRKTVTRIDAITGELLTTIPLTDLPGPYGSTGNRLAATTDAVWAVGEPAFRIDPATNQVTEIGGGDQAYAIAADGTTVWTAGFEGTIQRIEPDGTITTVYAPPDGEPRRAFMDLVVADGKLWALSQTRGNSRLLAIDPVTGDVAHDLLLSGDISTIGVRVVADQHGIVVGADTSGGGGRTGELYLIDPTTGTITDTVELPSRPEGIALTDDHIFTSAAVVDRHSLDVVDDTPFGFTIARGPDGSIWGTGAIEGSRSITFAARRFAPGDLG